MLGCMIMVGDIYNHALQSIADGLCTALAALLAASPRVPAAPTHSPTANRATPPQPQQCGECSTTRTPAPAAASWGMASPAGGAGAWWPAELGVPAASGSQNALRSASFPVQRCLVIAVHEHVRLYNTLDHQMSGVPQEQGRGSTVWWMSPPCR
jgi:hypothetical protein